MKGNVSLYITELRRIARSMSLVDELVAVVGKKNVITNAGKTLRFRKGYRSGHGDAVAVVSPTSLMAMWRVLNVLHEHNIVIIMQAQPIQV